MALLLAGTVPARAEKSIYMPKFMGTLRARYEYLTSQNLSAFRVQTLRFGVEGYVAAIMSYCGEVDFSDKGSIRLVNAYARVIPIEGLHLSLGQQRMPFTVAAHRSPHEQYFADRTFIARYAGIRDVGFVGSYAFPKTPITAQASIFNCSGTGVNDKFFTNTYGFSAKLIGKLHPCWYLAASTARMKKGVLTHQDWDIGGYFDDGLWHVEAEYLRRQFTHGALPGINLCDLFVCRNFPIEKKFIGGVAGALRYDYMGNNSTGTPGDDGKAFVDLPECHRITAGATLSFKTVLQADIRLNYEKFFNSVSPPSPTTYGDRLVLEIIAHF